MPANVEIKARVRDLAQLISRVERLSGSPGQVLLQTDTFFPAPRGRLKLRDLGDGRGQLVFYDRPNSRGPKLSHFTISPTDDPRGLTAVLSQALGEQGVVKKERHLYMVGQTRVHVDRVEGLGNFVELEMPSASSNGEGVGICNTGESPRPGSQSWNTGDASLNRSSFVPDGRTEQVVLQEQQSLQEGEEVARQLMCKLGIEVKDLISGAYLDLLLAGGESHL